MPTLEDLKDIAVLDRLYGNIMTRCYDPNSKRYKFYGARGIGIYPLWRGHKQRFIADVLALIGPRPRTPYSTQLDRIDPLGDYEPGNIRWVRQLDNLHRRTP